MKWFVVKQKPPMPDDAYLVSDGDTVTLAYLDKDRGWQAFYGGERLVCELGYIEPEAILFWANLPRGPYMKRLKRRAKEARESYKE